MTQGKKDVITWFTVNNILPLIFTAVTITVSFMALSGKLDLLTQRVDLLIENQKTIISEYKGVQVRLGTLELDHEKFETELNVHLGK